MNSIESILTRYIGLFAVIPLLAFLATLVWKNKQEKPIMRIVRFTKISYIVFALAYALIWLINGLKPIDDHLVDVYRTPDFVFAIHFYYDEITLVFSLVGAILFFLVSTFSRYYMHRDEGYKRFFNTVLFFALGYNFIVFSGNFETLFIGWEIIGLSSFLLIAFYRKRYLPVKNAFKVLSYYRVSDLALILVMWLMHHLTHENIDFTQLAAAKVTAMQTHHPEMAAVIAGLLLLAAMIKSAQFPFTSWLPRAMEGPTASSAIFYGSLSVHIGVFILLRTYPFWENILWVKEVIIVSGVLTVIISTLIATVQPTVKTQIAYSSSAQIGFMIIEVALGFHVLALVHFASNAFLRTYQLLVSPSVLSYLVHHQYFHYHPPQDKPVSKLRAAIYMLGIKEWNMDQFNFTFLWSPFKWIGRQLQWLHLTASLVVLSCSGIALLVYSVWSKQDTGSMGGYLPMVMVFIALMLILFAFAHRRSAMNAWIYLMVAHLFILSGIIFNADRINANEVIFYAAGILVSFVAGAFLLHKTKAIDNDLSLNYYHGYVYEDKNLTLLFLVAVLGIIGFPVTTAFVGMDVLFTYIHIDQHAMILLLALCFIFLELAAMRIFMRIYLGPHKKPDHAVAFRSS